MALALLLNARLTQTAPKSTASPPPARRLSVSVGNAQNPIVGTKSVTREKLTNALPAQVQILHARHHARKGLALETVKLYAAMTFANQGRQKQTAFRTARHLAL